MFTRRSFLKRKASRHRNLLALLLPLAPGGVWDSRASSFDLDH